MANKATVMFSLGRLEGWIEKVCKEFKLVADEPLRHFEIIEDAYKTGNKRAGGFSPSDTSVRSVAKNSGYPVVRLEFQSEKKVFVHLHRADGSEYTPGAAMRNGEEPCFEMWPIPKAFIFTVSDLRAIVRALDTDAKRLPYEDETAPKI